MHQRPALRLPQQACGASGTGAAHGAVSQGDGVHCASWCDGVMPTREQKAQAFKTWQVILDGDRAVVIKVRKDLAARCEERAWKLADSGACVATLCLEDAGWVRTVPLSATLWQRPSRQPGAGTLLSAVGRGRCDSGAAGPAYPPRHPFGSQDLQNS